MVWENKGKEEKVEEKPKILHECVLIRLDDGSEFIIASSIREPIDRLLAEIQQKLANKQPIQIKFFNPEAVKSNPYYLYGEGEPKNLLVIPFPHKIAAVERYKDE